MAFRVITDMKEADEYWTAGLLYYKNNADQWVVDDYYLRTNAHVDWSPSADEEREGAQNNIYAIFVEE